MKKTKGAATKSSAASAKLAGQKTKGAPQASDAPKDKGKRKSWSPGMPVSLPVRIVLIVFVVLMALSMMLPSLTFLVSGNNQQQEQQSQQAQQQDAENSQDASDSQSQQDDSASAIDARYQALVNEQQDKLDVDQSDLAALLNMGNDYMQWGSALLAVPDASKDTTHAKDIFGKAIATFDRYLALSDSSAVRVERAMCQYYAGDTDAAIASLKSLTEKDPSFGPAWANLGAIYQQTGNIGAAKDAYNQAISVEPNDEYGSKSFAQHQLAEIAASEKSPAQDGAKQSAPSIASSLPGAVGR